MESKSAKELWKKGYNFYFNLNNHEIHVYGSSLSGKEIIYVDGEIVCEKRSLLTTSNLEFILDGDKIEVELNVVSLLKSEMHCVLIKNDVHVETQIISSSPKTFWMSFAAGTIMGFVGMVTVIMLVGF